MALSPSTLRLLHGGSANRTQPQPEQPGLAGRALSGVGSGLAYIGTTLNKPSRALWGTASGLTGGDWGGGLLNLVPFSDTLGLTDPHKGIEASGFAEHIGLIPENKPGFDVFDIPRFGLDVVGDPTSWATGLGTLKAAGKGGQALQRAGLFDDIQRASGLGPREFMASNTLRGVMGGLDDVGTARLGEAMKGMGGIDDALDAPLGGVVGLAKKPVFGDAVTTLGTPEFARKLDQLGGWIGQTPPARAANWALDYASKGRVGREEQAFAKAVTREQERTTPQAVNAIIKGGRKYLGMLKEFTEQTGDELFADMADDIVDPAMLDERISKLLEREMSAWKDPALQAERAFRQKHFGVIRQLQQGKDPASIPGFDLLHEDLNVYRDTHWSGTGDVADEDLIRDILSRASPRPTRAALSGKAKAELESEQLFAGSGATGTIPWKPGDVVLAGDRENYGWVQKVGPKSSRVMFRNPDTGVPAEKILRNDQLSRAFGSGSEQAQEFQQLATAKVFSDILRHIGEVGDTEEAFSLFAPQLGRGFVKNNPEFIEKMTGTMAELKAVMDAPYADVLAMGGKGGMLGREEGSLIDHVTRQWARAEPESILKREGKLAPHRFDAMKGRTAEIRELPAATVKELSANRRYRGEGAATRILDDFGEQLDGGWLQKQMDNADDTDFLVDVLEATADDSKAAHAEALAEWLEGRGAMETRMVMEDAAEYLQGVHVVQATIRASHDYLHEAAQKFAGGDDGIALGNVFKRAQMNEENAVAHFAQRFGMSGDEVAKLKVAPDAAQAVVGAMQLFNERLGETALQPFLEKWDGWTRAFKTYVTMPWPAFFVRNFGSGQFVNASSGYVNGIKDLNLYGKAFHESIDLLKRAKSGAMEAGDQEMLDAILSYGVFNATQGFEGVEHLAAGAAGWLPADVRAFGKHRQAARDWVQEHPTMLAEASPIAAKVLNPLQRGAHTTATIGSALNQNVEWVNRVPMFMYLRGKGYADDVAAKIVEDLHFDYGKLSPFQKEAVKRVVPFSTFTMKASRMVFDRLAERPGGPLAQTIRFATQARDPKEEVPEHVSQSTAIPLGKIESGASRFITGLGLAHEDPLSFGPNIQSAGLELLSRTHPLIKGPIEMFTGESLFQRGPMGGRDLADMDPTIGRTISNITDRFTGEETVKARPFISQGVEHVLANTPFSRALTTMRTISDPRKLEGAVPGLAMATQLLTGVRLTDVSPQQSLRLQEERLGRGMRDLGAYGGQFTTFTKSQIAAAERTDPARAEEMKALNEQMKVVQRQKRELREEAKSPRVRLRRSVPAGQ